MWVPIQKDSSFNEARAFAREIADWVAGRHPGTLTTEERKSERAGRLYLDVSRNAYGQTVVAPYSLRPGPGAPVATPLRWNELGKSGSHSRTYALRNIRKRLGDGGDPWARMGPFAASLPRARREWREKIDGTGMGPEEENQT